MLPQIGEIIWLKTKEITMKCWDWKRALLRKR
jgi:DNA/RNA-binding domain of Phe-tRNA-synthetase-like protein